MNTRVSVTELFSREEIKELTTASDLHGAWAITAHDFRATASTLLNEMGYEEKWIESQLAHADENKTRASYNHAKYLVDRKKMMQDWADIVDSWKDLK